MGIVYTLTAERKCKTEKVKTKKAKKQYEKIR
jgi:hypothetical protein